MQKVCFALLLSGVMSVSMLTAQTKENTLSLVAVAQQSATPFALFRLPYATDALAPVISQQTVELHYGKHVVGYHKKLNQLVCELRVKERDLVRLVRMSEGSLFDNAGQLLNHWLYFQQFRPYEAGRVDEPQGELRAALLRSFRSLDSFRVAFEKAGGEIFGSGWLWLVTDESGRLSIAKTSNADSPVTSGLIPLLAIDIWEHAYYLDYANRRAEHLHALWQIIDWKVIERRYAARATGVQL